MSSKPESPHEIWIHELPFKDGMTRAEIDGPKMKWLSFKDVVTIDPGESRTFDLNLALELPLDIECKVETPLDSTICQVPTRYLVIPRVWCSRGDGKLANMQIVLVNISTTPITFKPNHIVAFLSWYKNLRTIIMWKKYYELK